MNTEREKETLPAQYTTDIKRKSRTFKDISKTVSDRIYGKKYLFFCFAVPAAIMLAIYFFMGVYPVGKNSVLVLDLNGQYVYYFEALRKILTEGGSFLYSFSRALGGEFMGIFAYYLASPLSFIVALFPKENITEALLFLIVLKCGMCGAAFGFYLHKTRKRRPVLNVMFSCMYALCSFAVVMQHNVMWTDNLIFLPLVILGIEDLVKKGSLGLFTVSLSLCVFSNFYIGYMMCIFSAIYFFYYYFSSKKSEINPLGEKRHFMKSFLRIALAALSVICICAIIILPTYYSLSFGKTDFSNPSFKFEQKFDFTDLLTKMLFGSYDTVRPEGLPFLYTGTLTLILLPLYFLSSKVTLKKKVASSLLISALVLSMNGSVFDLVWHGMQKPNWLNYRYAFILCFFLLYFAYDALCEIKSIGYRKILASGALVGLITVILQKFDYKNMPDITCVWATLAFCLVYLFMLKASVSDSAAVRQTCRSCLCIVVCFELFAGGLLNLYALDNDVLFSNRTGYRTFIDNARVVANDIKRSDGSFYRTEKTTHRKTNDNLALGIYGLSNSTSTLNASTIKFLNRMGFASKSHWSKYLGETPVSDSLLGIKYIISKEDDKVSNLYTKEKEYPVEKLVYYKNPYALSVAFGVSPKYLNCSFTDDTAYPSPFQKMNILVNHMLGEPESKNVFTGLEYEDYSTSNITETYIASHVKYAKTDKNSEASVTFYVKALDDGPVFCYFPSQYTREVGLYVNSENKGTFFANETYRITNLGDFKKGELISVRLELSKDELYLKDECIFFWQLDENRFYEASEKLSECELDVTNHSEDRIEGKINIRGGATQIFTSIPYDEGWKVTCDGEPVEISQAIDALLTFTLPEGEHEIVMKYRPSCVTLGAVISIIGIISFIFICAGNNIIRKRNSEKTLLPETSAGSEEEKNKNCSDTEEKE